jgi:hypothetical protein
MPVPPGGYSITEFRELHGYSESTYRSLRKRGLAPKETLLPDSKYSRITEKDYCDWLKLISRPDVQFKEHLRRIDKFQSMGRIASQSHGHPAQVWSEFKRLKITKPKPIPKRKVIQAAE